MLQSEKKLKARHREKNYFKRPRSTQDLIPVDTVYPDGMFLSNGNIYSKSYRFSDINYQIAGQAEKEGIIREMRALAKGCTPGEMSQITIVNRHINRELLERLQYTSAGDGLDGLRGEMNRILENQAGRGTGIIQERYFTTSVSKSTPREATIHFDRVGTELERLDSDTELIRNVTRGKNCELNICTEQQLDAVNTVLPYGLDRISMDRSLTTETLAAFVPFSAQEICDSSGVLYGQNAVTRNLVVVDRLAKSSGNGFVLGMTGGGKSFFCKNELVSLRLKYPPDKAGWWRHKMASAPCHMTTIRWRSCAARATRAMPW